MTATKSLPDAPPLTLKHTAGSTSAGVMMMLPWCAQDVSWCRRV